MLRGAPLMGETNIRTEPPYLPGPPPEPERQLAKHPHSLTSAKTEAIQKRASRKLADPKHKKLKLKLMGRCPCPIDCHSGRRYASELRVLHVLGALAVQSKGGQSKYLQTDNRRGSAVPEKGPPDHRVRFGLLANRAVHHWEGPDPPMRCGTSVAQRLRSSI
jgi:hypothetical protein